MPNWCSTVIKFYSKNKEQIVEMHKQFVEIINGESTQENDFKNGWMGDFANTFFPELGAEKIDCRGWVDGIDDEDEIDEIGDYTAFTVWTQTAWGPKIGIWNEIIKKFYPEVKMAYYAEEYGCCLYCKWDEDNMFYPDEFYVDICYPDKKDEKCQIDDHYQFGSIEEIQKYLDDEMGLLYEHKNNIDEQEAEVQSVLDAYAEEHDCEGELYCVIEKFEVEPPENFSFLN